MTTQSNAINQDTVLQWVTFHLAGEKYGVNVMQVQEVLRYNDIAPVPGAPMYVLGIINLRGKVVTVLDTRNRFGLPEGEVTEQSRIIVLESDGHVIGILVDSVAEVAVLSQSGNRCSRRAWATMKVLSLSRECVTKTMN